MNSKISATDRSVVQKLAAGLPALVLLLAGCAGQVTQSTEAPKPEVRSLRNVSLAISPQATLKIADDVEFDIGAFEAALRESLKSSQLMASDGDFDLNVVINEVRIRGTGSVVLFGFLAGDGHITGEAEVHQFRGRQISIGIRTNSSEHLDRG